MCFRLLFELFCDVGVVNCLGVDIMFKKIRKGVFCIVLVKNFLKVIFCLNVVVGNCFVDLCCLFCFSVCNDCISFVMCL